RAGMAESIKSLRLENLKIRDDRDDLRRKLRRNGNGNGNGNGGNGNVNGGNGNGQGENGNGDERGDRLIAHECTYQDFIKCQPLNFKGTKGVVGLIRWCEKMETVFHISNCLKRYQVKELMKLMIEVYCSRNEIPKMETKLWNLSVKNNDKATYTQRFQELTMMCTKMVLEEEDRVEKFIGENKRKFDTKHRDNRGQQSPFKRQNTGGQLVAKAYTAGNNDKRDYEGTLPYCNRSVIAITTQGTPGPNQKVVMCFECGAQGHYRKNCPKVKNQNHRNKARVPDARGKAYFLGGGDANPSSNTIMGDKSDEKKSMLSIISCVKAHKYMEKGCQLFLAQVTVKENKDKSKDKRLEDVPILQDFPKVFPEDLPGLPPIRQVEF
nr:hypothetical protein [Tanacetum cinerariifolium]